MRLQQRKMCEGCGLKVPSYGLPAERRTRWCGGCAKKIHPSAVSSCRKGPAASAPSPRAPTTTRPSKRRKVTKMPAEQLAPLLAGFIAAAGGDDGGSDGEEAEILRPAAQPLVSKFAAAPEFCCLDLARGIHWGHRANVGLRSYRANAFANQ